MGVQNPIAFTNEAQLLMGGANLFDPFTTQPVIKPSHEQISPSGQSPLGTQPFFMGNPLNFQFGGYYNLTQPGLAQPNFMAQPDLMAQPPFGFAMPPTPPDLFSPEEQEEPQSSPAANEHRGISVSPVSSPVAAQLPTFQLETLQPEIESPEQQFDEATVSNYLSSITSPTIITRVVLTIEACTPIFRRLCRPRALARVPRQLRVTQRSHHKSTGL